MNTHNASESTKDISLLFSKKVGMKRIDINLELISDTTGSSFLEDVDSLSESNRVSYLKGSHLFFRNTVGVYKQIGKGKSEVAKTASVLANAKKESVRASRPKAAKTSFSLIDKTEVDKPLICRNTSRDIIMVDNPTVVDDVLRALSKPHMLRKINETLQEISSEVQLDSFEDFELVETSHKIPEERGSGIAKEIHRSNEQYFGFGTYRIGN